MSDTPPVMRARGQAGWSRLGIGKFIFGQNAVVVLDLASVEADEAASFSAQVLDRPQQRPNLVQGSGQPVFGDPEMFAEQVASDRGNRFAQPPPRP